MGEIMTRLSIEAKISWVGAFGNRTAYLTACRTKSGIKKRVAEWIRHHPDVQDVMVTMYHPEICGDNVAGKCRYINGKLEDIA